MLAKSWLEIKSTNYYLLESVDVGKHLMKICADDCTPLVLELGGKDPMIVLKDADLDQASSAAVWGAFTNAGQCCASVERVYVESEVYDDFIERVVKKAGRLKVGQGLSQDTDVGPLTNLKQKEKVIAQVEDAKQRGGIIEFGGEDIPGKGFFYKPTIISHVDHSFDCMNKETFGPIMPVMPFHDFNEVLELANDSEFGLTLSIWTRNKKRALKIADNIKTGTVMINDCVFTHALSTTPWGGVKSSGFGKTHSKFGLREVTNIQHLHINKSRKKSFWWYSYSSNVVEDFRTIACKYTGGFISKLASLPAIYRRFKNVN